MIKISPFTPLFFSPSSDKFGAESKYVQTFAPTDRIFIQAFSTGLEEVTGSFVNHITGASTQIEFSNIVLEDGISVFYGTITGLENGYYTATIGGKESEMFKITDNERDLEETTLIRYTMRSNKQRKDCVFWNGEEQFFFEFRAPGGFKDDDWAFSVNNEQFEISNGNIVELFAIESTQKKFTLGNSIGCPVWYAEHLNRILCCSNVTFNGKRFVRKGNSVPEMTQEVVAKKSYIFKVSLQGMADNVDVELPSGEDAGGAAGGAGGEGYIYLIKLNDETIPTDRNTFSSLRVLFEIQQAIKKNNEKIDESYLSKIKPDSTAFLLKLLGGVIVDGRPAQFNRGAQFGENFIEGLTGMGGFIDKEGRGELRSLRLWEGLDTPQLNYNVVKVWVGVDWQCAGGGLIESVSPDLDRYGKLLDTGTATLKLEEGQWGAVCVDDMAMGIYHMTDLSMNATSDKDDSRGNFAFAGFATSYFRIIEVSGVHHETIRYSLRPGYTIHPQPMMSFACYGNFTLAERQQSTYRTPTYTRRLWKQNTWEIGVHNIAAQDGDLSNLTVHGLEVGGYSAYLNNVYFSGLIKQVKPDGTPIVTANDRGAWKAGKFDYYDRVSHNGCLWLCVNEAGTTAEPSDKSADWLKQVDKGEPGIQGVGFAFLGDWHSGMTVPAMGVVRMLGNSYVAKVETSRPPLGCYMLNGSYLTYNGHYLLTGNVNDEYELFVEKGADGRPGKDGETGKPGIQGCILRKSEWAVGVAYKNDEAKTSGTRYVDVALVKDTSTAVGWRAYKCRTDHTSSSSNKPSGTGTTTYWEPFALEVSSIFTSLVIAKDASLDFIQGNELLIKDNAGTVVGGLTGGASKEAGTTSVRIWVGDSVPDKAPFRVLHDGSFVSAKANITGKIIATSGEIGNFRINGGVMENKEDEYIGDGTQCGIRIISNNYKYVACIGLANPASVGFQVMADFEHHGDYSKNVAMILKASGAKAKYNLIGGLNNICIDEQGGVNWQIAEGDHWCMPGLLKALRVYQHPTDGVSVEYQWGNGVQVTKVGFEKAKDGAGDGQYNVIEYTCNHNNIFVLAVNHGTAWGRSDLWNMNPVVEMQNETVDSATNKRRIQITFWCTDNRKYMPHHYSAYIFGYPDYITKI